MYFKNKPTGNRYFLTAVFIKTLLRILSTVFEEFNKLLLAISGFSKPAKLFCQFVIWICIAARIILVPFLQNWLQF
jgi:hypothetical protein